MFRYINMPMAMNVAVFIFNTRPVVSPRAPANVSRHGKAPSDRWWGFRSLRASQHNSRSSSFERIGLGLAGGIILAPTSSDPMRRRGGVPALFPINHYGRIPIVFKCDHRSDRRVGLFYTLAATVRHDNVARVAQGQNPSVAQTTFHRDNRAHYTVTIRLGRCQDNGSQVSFGCTLYR